jgi:hypothetical protein
LIRSRNINISLYTIAVFHTTACDHSGSNQIVATFIATGLEALGAVINYDYTLLAVEVPTPSLYVRTGATMLIPQGFGAELMTRPSVKRCASMLLYLGC